MIAELMSGLVSVCEGSLTEKFTFIFECCDYNNSHCLNYDDFFMLLFAVFSGVSRMAGRPCPTEVELQTLCDGVFKSFELDCDTGTMRRGESAQSAGGPISPLVAHRPICSLPCS
jgi:hypothetical protein